MAYKSPEVAVSDLCAKLPSLPLDRDALNKRVASAVKDTPSSSSAELRKAKWELALKTNTFDLAVRYYLICVTTNSVC